MFSFKKIFQSKLIFIPPKKSKILILDKGHTQHAGTHSELLKQSELYRSSWAYQEALEDL